MPRCQPVWNGLEKRYSAILQAEIFKVRDRNNVVIGVASRLASASEQTGPFIEWVLHLPARGTVYLQMDLAPSADGHRNGC